MGRLDLRALAAFAVAVAGLACAVLLGHHWAEREKAVFRDLERQVEHLQHRIEDQNFSVSKFDGLYGFRTGDAAPRTVNSHDERK